MKSLYLFLLLIAFSLTSVAQEGKPVYTRQDSLAGSNTPGRSWWDAQRYDVVVNPDYATKSIKGRVTITYKVIADQHSDYMQIDLQEPLAIDSLYYNGNI